MIFKRAADQNHHPFMMGLLASCAVFLMMAAISTPASSALDQGVIATPLLVQSTIKLRTVSTSTKNSNTPQISSKPTWQELTPAQQASLQPLAANWNTLEEAHKRKWLAIAMNYPNLAPTEQAKIHSRMTEWVSLNQQQRTQARLNFARSKQLTSNQKTATWQAYQALSPEEKQKLATLAIPRLTGAATAAKPVLPQKLAIVPMTRQTPVHLPKLSAANETLNRSTLLPNSQPSSVPASAQKKAKSPVSPE